MDNTRRYALKSVSRVATKVEPKSAIVNHGTKKLAVDVLTELGDA
jgi:hypothetical protein